MPKNEHIPSIKSTYLTGFLSTDSLTEKVELVTRALKKIKNDFDAIAFRGMSGALVAPGVAMALGKSLIMVRKRNESSHSTDIVEGDYAAKRYVIVDDFISSGRTVYEIQKEIKKVNKTAVCIGTIQSRYISAYCFKRSAKTRQYYADYLKPKQLEDFQIRECKKREQDDKQREEKQEKDAHLVRMVKTLKLEEQIAKAYDEEINTNSKSPVYSKGFIDILNKQLQFKTVGRV